MVKEETKPQRTIVQRLGKNTIAIVVILCLLFAVIMVYMIAMFELYKERKFIFSPYNVSKPSDAFYPLGQITQLTQEEIDTRNAVIKANS